MMKSSNYNIFFPNEDKIIGYNSLSDNFVILEPVLHELFQASVHENIIEELPSVHENLYDILLEKGFVIDDHINEFEEIKRISNETDFDETHYELTINPTMNCNFKCWYCYETHIKDSKMDQGTLENILKHIDNVLLEKKGVLKKFTLQWFGGEPMLYFKKVVLPMMREIYPKMVANGIKFESGFTTNGLLINQGILDGCKEFGVSGFQITLDGHRERHNKVRFISESRGSYDKIVSNIKLCLRNKLHVTTRVNISEETVDDLLKIIDDFKDISFEDKQYLIFSFHEVWQEEKNLTADISAIVEQFRFNNLKSNYLGENNASIRNSCYADKLNHATINYNGDVFKCTARDFEDTSREGKLDENGAIQWNEKFQQRIYDTRFTNKPCLECKILPICNGGCSQHRLEHVGEDYCIFNFNEDTKLDVVKEKFFSRVASRAPSNHFNDTINRLLEINFKEFKKHDLGVFQESLPEFFKAEVRESNLAQINEINDFYASSIKHLRKNEMDEYYENQKSIGDISDNLELNPCEEKVASLFALPVFAYYHYKKGDYKKSLEFTNESILNDDFFLDRHPSFYGNKIQQLHNVMRVLFKANFKEDASTLCGKVLSHLIFGSTLDYEIGHWHKDYKIDGDLGMTAMLYQVFTETVRTITDISLNDEMEHKLFKLAFGNLIHFDKSNVSDDIRPLLTFAELKLSLIVHNEFDERKVNTWVEDIKNVSFGSLTVPLFYSLFSSLGINSFNENKAEYKRIYA